LKKPHQSSLRKGRYSTPQTWYSVTTCIKDRQPLLVPDPFHPLFKPLLAQIVGDTIQWLHHQNYWQYKAFVVMPDHVHIIFVLGQKTNLSKAMNAFGKYTARKINGLSGKKGQVWQRGFYDHCLRNEDSYLRHLKYVWENPVRKGFVEKAEDWPFSEIEPAWRVVGTPKVRSPSGEGSYQQ